MFLSIKVEKMYTFDNTQCRRVCIWGNNLKNVSRSVDW